MDKTVEDRISRFVDMGGVLDYSSAEPAADAESKSLREERERMSLPPYTISFAPNCLASNLKADS
jgi:hypothetical protein